MVVALKKLLLIFALFFIAGCAQAKDFDYGISQLNSVNSKYNATMEIYPKTISQIDSMLSDFKELKKLQLESGQQAFSYAVDYEILNLEAEKLYIQGQKYGSGGTTKLGLGCKSRPIITESVSFRNSSALKGFEAAGLLREFAEKYPKESKLIGLSSKNALFLNATFYGIWAEAKRDSSIINRFCPKNVTLELYQKEISEKTNLSKDFIISLSYEEAADIWKKIRGIG